MPLLNLCVNASFIVLEWPGCIIFPVLLNLVNFSGCFQNPLVRARLQDRIRHFTLEKELRNCAVAFFFVVVGRIDPVMNSVHSALACSPTVAVGFCISRFGAERIQFY